MCRSRYIVALLQARGSERLPDLTWIIGIIWGGLKALWLCDLGFEGIVWEESGVGETWISISVLTSLDPANRPGERLLG